MVDVLKDFDTEFEPTTEFYKAWKNCCDLFGIEIVLQYEFTLTLSDFNGIIECFTVTFKLKILKSPQFQLTVPPLLSDNFSKK